MDTETVWDAGLKHTFSPRHCKEDYNGLKHNEPLRYNPNTERIQLLAPCRTPLI
jgi:hypothetical protein